VDAEEKRDRTEEARSRIFVGHIPLTLTPLRRTEARFLGSRVSPLTVLLVRRLRISLALEFELSHELVEAHALILHPVDERQCILAIATQRILIGNHGIIRTSLELEDIPLCEGDMLEVASRPCDKIDQLSREEILFVAFGGWDAAGAKSFGYPTYWANRMTAPAEQLGAIPDYISDNLKDLLPYVFRT